MSHHSKLYGAAIVFLMAMMLGHSNIFASTEKAYKGADLPKDQLAIVRPDRQKSGMMAFQTVQFFQVDDIDVGGVLRGWPKQVEVPAGEHKIIFRFFNSKQESGSGPVGSVLQGGVIGGAKKDPSLSEKKTITFKSTAGHEYIFKFFPQLTPDRFWIEDKADGSVAGEYKSNAIDLNSIFKKK